MEKTGTEIKLFLTEQQLKEVNTAFLSGPRCVMCYAKMRKGKSPKLVWATPYTLCSSQEGRMAVNFACPDCHKKLSNTMLRARKKKKV